jgi:thiamine biosynthesis lipoprotein
MTTMKQVQFRAMGTDVVVAAHAAPDYDSQCLDNLLGQVQDFITTMEHRFSRFIPGNEVDSLNQSTGLWTDISPELSGILFLAKSAYVRSEGLFSPFLGCFMEDLGYRTSFEKMEKNQNIKETGSGKSNSSATGSKRDPNPRGNRKAIATNQSEEAASVFPEKPAARPLDPLEWPLEWHSRFNRRVRLQQHFKVDLGGIAKGWIVEQSAAILRQGGILDFVVDAGGDMLCSGNNRGEAWHIGVENPVTGAQLVVDVNSTCVATSGTYKRRWQRNGSTVHHILDPRTGRPAETDFVSCSVFHESLTEAEWMAKTLLIRGSDTGLDWIECQPQRGWVATTQDGEVKHAWM